MGGTTGYASEKQGWSRCAAKCLATAFPGGKSPYITLRGVLGKSLPPAWISAYQSEVEPASGARNHLREPVRVPPALALDKVWGLKLCSLIPVFRDGDRGLAGWNFKQLAHGGAKRLKTSVCAKHYVAYFILHLDSSIEVPNPIFFLLMSVSDYFYSPSREI